MLHGQISKAMELYEQARAAGETFALVGRGGQMPQLHSAAPFRKKNLSLHASSMCSLSPVLDHIFHGQRPEGIDEGWLARKVKQPDQFPVLPPWRAEEAAAASSSTLLWCTKWRRTELLEKIPQRKWFHSASNMNT